jgi:gluconolactonase
MRAIGGIVVRLLWSAPAAALVVLGCAETKQPPRQPDAAALSDGVPGASVPAEGGRRGVPLAQAVCPPDKSYAASPLPPSPEVRELRGGLGFLEGPVWLAQQGVLLFSDMDFQGKATAGPPSTIHRFTPPDRVDVFLAASGSNGLALDAEGGLIACTHDTQSVSRIDLATKQRTVLAQSYQGKRFNSPNDLAARSDGTIYFTDPDWQLGGRKSETGMTGVYRIPVSGPVTLVDGTLSKPNGIALSLDERTLYVGALDGVVRRYQVAADGSTGAGAEFARVPGPDGMTVDCAGNLYVTGGGRVHVFDAQGSSLGTIDGVESATNVAFGGPERRTLYITAGPSGSARLYAIELGVPGLPY